MAIVYRAYQPALDRYVAVKIISASSHADAQFTKRFKREAHLVAALEHPRILPIYDYGTDGDLHYLVTRLITGRDLAEVMQAHRVPIADALTTVTQVAEALGFAHARGVIHRDVKPSNILLDQNGDALLADFGIARILESDTALTSTGAFIGTPTYASPEQCAGRTLDARTDIYSLGVVLYALAVGRPPFLAETPMAVALKHINDPLPSPRSMEPMLPIPVERVILKALAKDPDHRFTEAADLIRALAEARSATPAHHPRPSIFPNHPTSIAFLVLVVAAAITLTAALAISFSSQTMPSHPTGSLPLPSQTSRPTTPPAPTTDVPTAAPLLAITNIAPEGTVDASSSHPVRPSCFLPIHVVDGDLSDTDTSCHAWASNREVAGAWVRVSFPTTRRASVVRLYDRPTPPRIEHVLSGTLEFSDGSSIEVGALPDDGSPLEISFDEKAISWLLFTVTRASGANIGLAEIEILGR